VAMFLVRSIPCLDGPLLERSGFLPVALGTCATSMMGKRADTPATMVRVSRPPHSVARNWG
jgi:hypothetical protein